MKAVILAAGRGSRLGSVTGGRPKCLLSFGGRTILDRQIDALLGAGVAEIALVVGHAKQQLIAHVHGRYEGEAGRISFIENPEYADTNNMVSLWLAREWLGDDPFVCLNADVLCHRGVVQRAVEARGDLVVLIDREYREETTKVRIEDDRVVALAKTITRANFDGTFVNIATFSAAGGRTLFAAAEEMFAAGQRNQFYNDVLHLLAGRGVAVGYEEIGDLPWAEIDDGQDLAYAQREVLPRIAAVEAVV